MEDLGPPMGLGPEDNKIPNQWQGRVFTGSDTYKGSFICILVTWLDISVVKYFVQHGLASAPPDGDGGEGVDIWDPVL